MEGGVVEGRQGVVVGSWGMVVAGKAMASGWREMWGVVNSWRRWFVEMGSREMGRGVDRGNWEGSKVIERLLRDW